MKITPIFNIYTKNNITFSGNNDTFEQRYEYMLNEGIEKQSAERIAKLDDTQYERAKVLTDLGTVDFFIDKLAKSKEKDYKKGLRLIKKGFIDETLPEILNGQRKAYNRALRLERNGIDPEKTADFIYLDDKQFNEAIQYLKKGLTPITASILAENNNEAELNNLLAQNIDIETARDIMTMSPEEKSRYQKYINMGFCPANAINLALLEDYETRHVSSLSKMNIDEDYICVFTSLKGKDYKRALELINQGVCFAYIMRIISLEKGERDNKKYNEYLSKGLSKTSACALSLFDDDEIKALKKLIKINPQMAQLLKDEYDVTIEERQDTCEFEAIFKKIIRTNKSKIEIIQIFNQSGKTQKSRTETYQDGSVSSYQNSGEYIFKSKYDKNKNLKELIQYIPDKITHGIKGVVYTKASTLLKGAYESTYYDISQFRESGQLNSSNKIDYPLNKSVKGKGITISSVTKEADGSIKFTEKFTANGCKVYREYSERKDTAGKTLKSNYIYKITDQNGNSLLDISRSTETDSSGRVKNIINGNEYTLTFDDKHKTVTIRSGNKIRTINLGKKLAYFGKEKLWQAAKNLPADILIDIDNNIEHWNYTDEEFSSMNERSFKIYTGQNKSIIGHECGHIKAFENPNIEEDEELQGIYKKEMALYEQTMPHHEQKIIEYFSPQANLSNSIGLNEFIAETNSILITYGYNIDILSDRSQFLIRYFPKTIAKIAELMGRNSKANIL